MIVLVPINNSNNEYFEEIEKLFEQYKHNLDCEDLNKLIENMQGHFYTATKDNKFIGCMFLYRWDLDNKLCYLGGFSVSKNKLTYEAVDFILKYTFKNYSINRIYIEVFERVSKIFLLKFGFKKENEQLFYIERH